MPSFTKLPSACQHYTYADSLHPVLRSFQVLASIIRMQIPYTQFHPYLDKSVESTYSNLFTPISEIWLSAPIFTKISVTLMYMEISTEFYPNMTKDV